MIGKRYSTEMKVCFFMRLVGIKVYVFEDLNKKLIVKCVKFGMGLHDC